MHYDVVVVRASYPSEEPYVFTFLRTNFTIVRLLLLLLLLLKEYLCVYVYSNVYIHKSVGREEVNPEMRHNLVIPDDVMKAFKVFIVNKQSDIKKGDTSKWVVIAMKNLIRQERQQHQHSAYHMHDVSKEEEMISNLTELMKDISKFFWKHENPFPFRAGIDVHIKMLKDAISSVRDVQDPRTLKKWIERLVEFRFIHKSANNQYKILNDGHESISSQEERKQEFDEITEGLV